jgi:hypothetical protein
MDRDDAPALGMTPRQRSTYETFVDWYRRQAEADGHGFAASLLPAAHGEWSVCARQGDRYRNFLIGARGGAFFRPANSARRGVYGASYPDTVPLETQPSVRHADRLAGDGDEAPPPGPRP